MTISYSNFFIPTVLTTSAVTLFTVPTQPTGILLRGARIRFTNTTGSAASVSAYAIPSAGIAAAGNAFVSGKSVAANDYFDVDVPVMPAGAFLQALSGTASAITVHMISGSYFS